MRDGNDDRMMGEFDDVALLRAETDRLRAQLSEVEALRALDLQSRENNRRVQTALTAGAIIGTWNWHPTEDYFTIDEGFAHAFGHDPKYAFEGLPIDMVLANVHPEDRPGLDAAIADAVARGGSYATTKGIGKGTGLGSNPNQLLELMWGS